MEYTTVTADEFAELEGLGDWRHVGDAVEGAFELDGYATAAAFVAEVGRLADALDHHPEVALSYPGVVRITVTTHTAGGQVTDRHVELARAVSTAAANAGASRRDDG